MLLVPLAMRAMQRLACNCEGRAAGLLRQAC